MTVAFRVSVVVVEQPPLGRSNEVEIPEGHDEVIQQGVFEYCTKRKT